MTSPLLSHSLLAAAALALLAPAAQAQAQAQFLPSPAQFEQLFPERIAFYSYEGFAEAVRRTPAFAARGSEQHKRQEMAAFLAQISHESDQLKAQREYRRANWGQYCREQLPGERCAPGQQYYGRGPIQLSWNYQYKAAGEALGLDLWADPDLVARDAKVAWQTALWYWTTQPGVASQSAHAAMLAGAGFGATTRAINGVIECDKGDDAEARRKLNRRIEFYLRASAMFEVAPSTPLDC